MRWRHEGTLGRESEYFILSVTLFTHSHGSKHDNERQRRRSKELRLAGVPVEDAVCQNLRRHFLPAIVERRLLRSC